MPTILHVAHLPNAYSPRFAYKQWETSKEEADSQQLSNIQTLLEKEEENRQDMLDRLVELERTYAMEIK